MSEQTIKHWELSIKESGSNIWNLTQRYKKKKWVSKIRLSNEKCRNQLSGNQNQESQNKKRTTKYQNLTSEIKTLFKSKESFIRKKTELIVKKIIFQESCEGISKKAGRKTSDSDFLTVKIRIETIWASNRIFKTNSEKFIFSYQIWNQLSDISNSAISNSAIRYIKWESDNQKSYSDNRKLASRIKNSESFL